MTERLYYTDATLQAFEATVERCDADTAGRWRVVLDRTAFYPTSGGQPFDTGTLGETPVIDVVDTDDGVVSHVVTTPLEPGATVRGTIDWPRRFEHMQQHTGQHLLSAAFDRLFDVRTLSFHLGTEASTIDLAREVAAGEIEEALAEANRIVWSDRPVRVRFVSEDEAAGLPLRKLPVRGGTLRLVDVPDFDLSACGGTHVTCTGAVGMIAVTAHERFKGGTRLTFVCGVRALRAFSVLRDTVAAATTVLSVAATDLRPAVERLQAESREGGRRLRDLREQLTAYRAAELCASAQTAGPFRVVQSIESDLDAAALKGLAAAVVGRSEMVAVLAGGGSPVPVVIACSEDVDLNASALVRDAAAALGGRGGGTATLAQGGFATTPEAVLAFVRGRLSGVGESANEG